MQNEIEESILDSDLQFIFVSFKLYKMDDKKKKKEKEKEWREEKDGKEKEVKGEKIKVNNLKGKERKGEEKISENSKSEKESYKIYCFLHLQTKQQKHKINKNIQKKDL